MSKLVPIEQFKTIVNYAPLVSIDLIIKYENNILLGKRTNKPAKGYYFTPGGIVRKNESFKKALDRISQNELGVKLNTNGKFLGVYEHFYSDSIYENISTHYINHAYLIEIKEKLIDLPKEQHSEYKWVDIGELMFDETVHKYVKDYLKNLNLNTIGESK